jgi:hypothetical protein
VRRIIGPALAIAAIAAAPAIGAPGDQSAMARKGTAGGCAIKAMPKGPVVVGEQMQVDGAGDVLVQGNVFAFGDVSGMNVRITDYAGDARVCLRGRAVMNPRTRSRTASSRRSRARTIRLRPRAEQRISIMGRRVRATFRGDGNVMLSISGIGRVRLDGVGTFKVSAGPMESWPMKPISVRLRATPQGDRG